MSGQDAKSGKAAESATQVEGGAAPAEDPIATMFHGFGEFTDSGVGRLALLGCKVLLFNFFLWAPIVALGYMIFFW